MKVLRIMVYNHAFRLVPALNLSLFRRALSRVSCTRSFASSAARVRFMAAGRRVREIFCTCEVNSSEVMLFSFSCQIVKQIYEPNSNPGVPQKIFFRLQAYFLVLATM